MRQRVVPDYMGALADLRELLLLAGEMPDLAAEIDSLFKTESPMCIGGRERVSADQTVAYYQLSAPFRRLLETYRVKF